MVAKIKIYGRNIINCYNFKFCNYTSRHILFILIFSIFYDYVAQCIIKLKILKYHKFLKLKSMYNIVQYILIIKFKKCLQYF